MRQMLGRAGEAWGAESGVDRLVMVPARDIMTNSTKYRSVLACLAALLFAANASAQSPGPSGGGRPTGAAGPGGRSISSGARDGESRLANANFFELVALRIAQLEEDLNLTSASCRRGISTRTA